LTARQQLAFVARSLPEVFVSSKDRQRLHHVRAAIIDQVAAITTARSFQRQSVCVEKNILQAGPKELVPCLAPDVSKVDELRGPARGMGLVADVLIKKRNGCRHSLEQSWLGICQHPYVTQSVVFG